MHNPLPKDADTSFAFPSQCIMLKIVGAWPLKDSNPYTTEGRLYLCWSFTIIILIGLTCWVQSAFVFAAWGDILTVTECGCTVLMGIHNLLRLIHLSIKRSALKKLITEFVENIWISQKNEKEIAAKCEKDVVILKIISAMLFVLIWMYVLLPLIELFSDLNSPNKPFPYKMVFPYNANYGFVYGITYFLTSLAGFGVVTTLFSEDSLFGFFVAYACGQFRLLHRDIGNIIRDGQQIAIQKNSNILSDHFLQESVIQREYRRLLVKVIRHHNIIISFAYHLEKFFSPILLINFTISSLLICMVGLQIVAVKLTIGNLAKLVIYIVSALSQLFILCWKGDRLIEFSTHTAWVLYACNWQGFSVEPNKMDRQTIGIYSGQLKKIIDCPGGIQFTKDLQFALQRAQKPLTITALKFSHLSLKSFTTILSTSLSYFTLLQTLVERSE